MGVLFINDLEKNIDIGANIIVSGGKWDYDIFVFTVYKSLLHLNYFLALMGGP